MATKRSTNLVEREIDIAELYAIEPSERLAGAYYEVSEPRGRAAGGSGSASATNTSCCAAQGGFSDEIKIRGRQDNSVSYSRKADQIKPSEPIQQLINAGLLEELSAPAAGESGNAIYRLTPRGVIAIRLIRGVGEPPDWAADLM